MHESENREFAPGTNFLIRLTEYEIRQGFVVIGHRFEPFCRPGLPPESIVAEDATGERIASRIAGIAFSTALTYFRLFGHSGMLDRLGKEDGANVRALQSHGDRNHAILRIRVLECASLLREGSLEAGDYLVATIMDPGRERFRLLPLPARDIDDETKTAWKSGLAAAFEQAFATSPPSIDPFELVRTAYLRAEPSVLARPGGSWSDFYNEEGILGFITLAGLDGLDGLDVLWKTGTTEEEIKALLGSSLAESSMRPDDEFSLEARELELSVDAEDLVAFILDALWKGLSGSAAIRRALDRVLVNIGTSGLPGSAVASLRKYGRAFGKEFIECVDMPNLMRMTDRNARRGELLSIYERFLAWMRSYGYMPAAGGRSDRIAKEAMTTMAELVGVIHDLNLADLAAEHDTPYPDGHLRDLRDRAALAMASLESLRIDGPGTSRASRSDGRVAREPPEMQGRSRPRLLFGLGIVIEGIQPPVYRELSIPGNRTLRDLHACIQDAFGWSGRHLHEFEIGGTRYGDTSGEVYVPTIADDSVSLDSLGLRKGSSFVYTYDFGDDWRHRIRVRAKTPLSAAEAREILPSCPGGARAAPPEDCGGIPGYQNLLECMATPAAMRSEEQREFIAWKGRWTPDRFNSTAVNRMLAKR